MLKNYRVHILLLLLWYYWSSCMTDVKYAKKYTVKSSASHMTMAMRTFKEFLAQLAH